MGKFNELIASDTPVLVDFYAEWCGPCKMMTPILKDLASRISGSARIIKIDIDKNPAAATKYDVRSVPTLMIFKKGEIKWRQSGVVSADQLSALLKNLNQA